MNSISLEPFIFTIPLTITGEVVLWLLWLLVGLVGLTAFIITYHMYSFTRSAGSTTLLIIIHYGISAVFLIAATAAAFLFGI